MTKLKQLGKAGFCLFSGLMTYVACHHKPPVNHGIIPYQSEENPSEATIHTSGSALAQVQQCEGCHPNETAQWKDSPHRGSSLSNPWYTAALVDFMSEKEPAAQHCAGCHDPALLADDLMTLKQLQDLAADDARLHSGVGCLNCHGVQATQSGTGSYTISKLNLEFPDDQSSKSILAHRKQMKLSEHICTSCHRGFLGPATGQPHHRSGLDDASDWEDSAWAGNGLARIDIDFDHAASVSCTDCHMNKTGHRFPGAHRPLAALMPEQDLATQNMLKDSLETQIVRIETSESNIEIDILVRNTNTGHQWPGGLGDTQGAQLHLYITKQNGDVIAKGSTHPFAVGLINNMGHSISEHSVAQVRIPSWDSRIPPRGSTIIRYKGPKTKEMHSVEASVIHQRFTSELHQKGCDFSKTDWGSKLQAGSSQHDQRAIDGCLIAAETLVAQDQHQIDQPLSLNLSTHLAISEALLERRGDSAAEAEPWLKLAEDKALTSKEKASVSLLLGRLKAREGQTEMALAYFEHVQSLIPENPASFHQKGKALSAVWRWEEAVVAFQKSVLLSPNAIANRRGLAVALLANQQYKDALTQAQIGLTKRPRDPDLLRVQALALEELNTPSASAHEAWLMHRPDDSTTHLLTQCRLEDSSCALESNPDHIHLITLQ